MQLRKRSASSLVLGAVITGGLVAASNPAGADNGGNGSKDGITNVIYLLGDGMGRTHVTAGRERYYGAAGKLNMERATYTGAVSTYAVEKGTDLPALVTDSASSGTAWSSGVKTYNAAIGVDSYEHRVATLMEQAKAAKRATGNVSTAEITDATPAAMFSHALLRGCQGPTYSDASCLPKKSDGSYEPKPADPTLVTPIAEQIARNGVADVILGGGLARFEPDDEAALAAQGYQVLGSFGDPALPAGGQSASSQRVATRDDLAAAGGDKVIGLFNRGNLTVETAKNALPADAAQRKEPTLAELTTKAIDVLDRRHGKGFLLQVEGALIDKRSHANDAGQTLGEVKAFDDAVKVAMDFAKRDQHTLVIVTADHECAGFNIIEPGTFTNAEAAAPPTNIDTSNSANNSTPARPADANTRDKSRSSGISNAPGAASAQDTKNFGPATFRTADDPAEVTDGSEKASLWLTYLSGNHTGADVPIYASGPTGQSFATSQDNTDLYRKMHAALLSR